MRYILKRWHDSWNSKLIRGNRSIRMKSPTCCRKIKNQKYPTVKTVPTSNRKIEAKSISLAHIYMTTHFPVLVQGTSITVAGKTSFMGPSPSCILSNSLLICCSNCPVSVLNYISLCICVPGISILPRFFC
jgi:hypothetical protein